MNKFNEVMGSMENKKFDIILSNPPYGKIGVEVTWRIISEIEFEDFVNLLPANDYFKRENSKKYKLWQYVKNVKRMIPLKHEFEDAAVTTHMCKIQKSPNLFISAEEFEIESYADSQLNRFFYETRSREGTFTTIYKPRLKDKDEYNNKNCFYIGKRYASGGCLYKKDSFDYKWDVEKSVDMDELLKSGAKSEQALGRIGDFYFVKFNTSKECENFTKFAYLYEEGYKFISKVITAANKNSSLDPIKILPKVDWTKEWTVEEILKDYGYTDNEIQEVMNDLKNFKGMNE